MKWDQLRLKMEKVGLKEEDLLEKFILGSGRGGQKLQKTSSTVYLKHLTTGIEVKCQRSRSRELNRFFARRELVNQLEEKIFGKKSEKQEKIEKIRRQKERRGRRQKQKEVKLESSPSSRPSRDSLLLEEDKI